MIDDGDWPEDPFSGQHEAFEPDDLTEDPYGPAWHDGQPPDVPPTGHDGADGVDVWPAGAPDTSAGATGHGFAAAHGGIGAGDGDAVPAHRGEPGPHDPAGTHPAPAVDPDAPAGYGFDLFGPVPGVEVSPFPARLELDVSPSDGRDWVDVDLLGGPAGGSTSTALRFARPEELLADLHRLDGGAGAPSWPAVSESDDPAVRALSLRWRLAE